MADTIEREPITQRWVEEIDLAEKDCEPWWKSGDIIIRRYKNDERNGGRGNITPQTIRRRFAILWSNVQTLAPAIYAKAPTPVVTRRFRDEDAVAKIASEVLERALSYSIEAYDFDGRLQLARNDLLLPGRGQLWVRYIPTMRKVDQGDVDLDEGVEDEGKGEDASEEQEEVAYEEVQCDHVAWKDFLTNPAREWAETRWVGRRVFMSRADLVKRFGAKIGKTVSLDWTPSGYVADQGDKDRDTAVKRAQVYEIWDKTTLKVYWISKGHQSPLDVKDDPLGLKSFFPCPSPLCATQGPDSVLPVPDYVLYQDQAEELDELTGRIGRLQDALRMVGFYAGEQSDQLQTVFAPGNENKLIPVDSFDIFKENGGVKGIIEWIPIDMVMECLKGCYEARGQVIQDIYQITGISDIIRGESDPNATATAERLKGQWGSLRIRDRQKDVQRFARDLLRLKAEVIAEHFSFETLRQMTGVKLMTNAEKQQAQMQMQQQMVVYQGQAQAAQMQGQPPPPQPQPDPKLMELMQQPSWEDVMSLLKDDALRSFRIEIETDSTIEPDENAAKQSFNEFVTATSSLLQVASVIVPTAPYTAPLFAEIIKEGARLYRVNRGMEDTIEKVFSTAEQQPPVQPPGPPPEPQPDPNILEAEKIKGQTAMVQAQSEQQRTQADAALGMAELNFKHQELAVKADALKRDKTPQGSA